MNFKVVWTKQAAQDLEEIIAYISLDNSKAAFNIFKKIKSHCSKLKVNPERNPTFNKCVTNPVLINQQWSCCTTFLQNEITKMIRTVQCAAEMVLLHKFNLSKFKEERAEVTFKVKSKLIRS